MRSLKWKGKRYTLTVVNTAPIHHIVPLTTHPQAKLFSVLYINTLEVERNDQHFTDDIFKYIGILWKLLHFELTITGVCSWMSIYQWLSFDSRNEPIMTQLIDAHICVTMRQWVNRGFIMYTRRIRLISHIFPRYSPPQFVTEGIHNDRSLQYWYWPYKNRNDKTRSSSFLIPGPCSNNPPITFLCRT